MFLRGGVEHRADFAKAVHLDEPALLATVDATLWHVAQRCARLASLRRARERAGAYGVRGLLPAQTVQQTGEVLAEARAALDTPMGHLEDLARHLLEADDHYRAWKALQEVGGRGEDFVDLAVADAADPHHAAAWVVTSRRPVPPRDTRRLHRRHPFIPCRSRPRGHRLTAVAT
ncbi:hypothetical protein [Streptomyces sp. NPDC001480]|uniref:hypothetical protein n=1 Tax=Streptomyces sp. NPDC001480 TaxID=3364577 RepID=UPI0036B8024A